MPIELTCQGCQQRIRVADEHAGKKARCPNCQAINPVPGADTPPLFVPAATSASPQWTLKTDDGRVFGPVDRSELDRWHEDGRITPSSQLQRSGEGRWRPAGEVFPALGMPPTLFPPSAGHNPFRDNPYAAPLSSDRGWGRTWSQPHNGVLILVLGLIGCLACFLVAPFAVVMGHSALAKMKAGEMDPEGRGLAIAGTVLGWIGTAQFLFFGGLVFLGVVLD